MFCIDFNQFWAKKAPIYEQILNVLPQICSDPNIFPHPRKHELYTPVPNLHSYFL